MSGPAPMAWITQVGPDLPSIGGEGCPRYFEVETTEQLKNGVAGIPCGRPPIEK